jgi:hypothetical protein
MANEAGGGSVTQPNGGVNATMVSKAYPATVGGSVTRLSLWISTQTNPSVQATIAFAFFTASGNVLSMVPGSRVTFTITVLYGARKQEFSAPDDFTAFNVSAGDYLGCCISDGAAFEHFNVSGPGLWYCAGDQTNASDVTFTSLSRLDTLEADITAAEATGNPWYYYAQQ